jgi:aspartate/methionine/tyrosine aminotransferase
VPSDPGTLFGSDHHIRLAFGGPEEVVAEAGRRIVTATQSIAGVGVS